ncbi:MAG: hypothetical protein MZV64_60615, partial [Ignavibacteriales bacterium]|nr:hypothetical protein [Ignavibacteriales bacterium]
MIAAGKSRPGAGDRAGRRPRRLRPRMWQHEAEGLRRVGHGLVSPRPVRPTLRQAELRESDQGTECRPEWSTAFLCNCPCRRTWMRNAFCNSISIEKDVDGFSPINIGRLAQKGREPLVRALHALRLHLPARAGRASRSKAPTRLCWAARTSSACRAALLLIGKNATVTVCHSRTKDLPGVVRQADILIAAIGRTEMVRGDWIKPGAAVIDVGINVRLRMPPRRADTALVGDVNFDEAKEVAGFITPVPGGVGPMTIAMLMKNTLRAAEIQ